MFFIYTVMKHWSRLHREVIDSHPWKDPRSGWRGTEQPDLIAGTFKGPFQPNCSVILWRYCLCWQLGSLLWQRSGLACSILPWVVLLQSYCTGGTLFPSFLILKSNPLLSQVFLLSKWPQTESFGVFFLFILEITLFDQSAPNCFF